MREWGEHLTKTLPRGSVRTEVSLRDLTTFRIGGPARFVVTAQNREDLIRVLRECQTGGVPYYLLGGGSNVLFSDRGFPGVIIVNRLTNLEPVEETLVECGAGVPLMDLVRFAQERSLSGVEQLAGIPGSVGGAIVGNAGAFGRSIGEILDSVELLNASGKVERVHPEDLEMDYRETRLKYSDEVVLTARIHLAPGDSDNIAKTITEILDLRASKHPSPDLATAGSFFKNLPPSEPGGRRTAAGLILDRAGAKGLSVGDAAVYEKHANIIVNRGQAKARDVLELAYQMKKLAYEKEGVFLEEEVRRIGFSEEELARYDLQGVPACS